jgi:hypothetical protein
MNFNGQQTNNERGSVMKRCAVRYLGLGLAVVLVAPMAMQAQTVTMTANDSLGNSSFNSAGSWSDASAPSAGKDYSTAGFLLRSPASGASWTFAGDSLRVGGGSGGGTFNPVSGNNNAFLFKLNGQTINVANLILDGSQIRDGNGSGNNSTLTGNIFVTANNGAFMAQQSNIIESAISGSSTIFIGDNGSGEDRRVIIFRSALNTFTGSVILTNPAFTAARSRLSLDVGSVWNFVPLAAGVNNRISGVGTLRLDGAFNFDLSGASTTLGDSWQIIAPTSSTFVVTYGSSFGVNGFTDVGGDLWQKSANGTVYQFSELTGILSVIPEPSSVVLVLLGVAGLFASRRLRKD